MSRYRLGRCRRRRLNLCLDRGGLSRSFVVALVVEGVGPGAYYAEVSANQVRLVFFQRTGVGLLFGDAHLGEQVEYALRLYLELSRQLINPDFAHS